MGIDVTYTNGIIAAREKYFLASKLLSLCDMTAEEAFRALKDHGFGSGVETASPHEFECLIQAEEEKTDAFIRQYSPTPIEAEYLFADRDYHNAKALFKCKRLGVDNGNMFAPEGSFPLSVLEKAVESGDYSALSVGLKKTLEEAEKLLSEKAEAQKTVSGAEIGALFERAKYDRLLSVGRKNRTIQKWVTAKIDLTNILTVLRSADEKSAEAAIIAGGKVGQKTLLKFFELDTEKFAALFHSTPYADFVKKCFEVRSLGQPLTAPEKMLASFEIDELFKKKYELKREQPFLYYVLRRRAECANVRIVFVCLFAGLSGEEITKRLRSF